MSLKNKLRSLSLCCLIIPAITSCSFIYTYSPLNFKVISQKGIIAYVLNPYLTDTNMTIENNESIIEDAFSSDEYGVIGYDTILGLELCKKYDKYVLYRNYVCGSQTFINLKKDQVNPSEGCKIITNNENGSIGKVLSYCKEAPYLSNISYTADSSYDFYLKLSNGEYSNDYDFALIDQPYALRLVAHEKNNSLYGISKISYKMFQVFSNEWCKKQNIDNIIQNYADKSLFINKSFYTDKNNESDFKEFINTINKTCYKDINDAASTFDHVYTVDKDRDKQFELLGFSITEIADLQDIDVTNKYRTPYNYCRLSTDFMNSDLIKYLNAVGLDYDSKYFYND